MFIKGLFPFFDDDDASGTGSGKSDSEILGESLEVESPTEEKVEEEVAEEPKEEEVKTEEEVVEEEIKEAEEEPEKAEEEESKDVRFKDLKKDYPGIFKKYPQLAQVIQNERAFSQVFASPEEAKQAATDAEFFSGLEASIMNGDAQPLIDAVAKSSPPDFINFALDFSEKIRVMDSRLYAAMTAPGIRAVLKSAINAADEADNKNLRNSALFITKFLFGSNDTKSIEDLEKLLDEKPRPKEDDTVRTERDQVRFERYDNFRTDVNSDTYDSMKDLITKSFSPTIRITNYIKDKVIEDTLKEVDTTLAKDARHIKFMDSLFAKARQTNFNKESRRQLVDAYLRAAKALVPATLAKNLGEALGTTRVNNDKSRKEFSAGKRTSESSESRQLNRTPSAGEIDWSKTSDKMLLDGKFVRRKG